MIPDATSRTLTDLALAGKLGQNLKTCATVAEATGRRPCVAEPKYDGWRILAHVTDDGVKLYSRKGIRYDGRLPHVEAELAQLPAGTWVDGEAVAMSIEGGDRIHHWGSVQSVMGCGGDPSPEASRVTFMAFDLLAHAGIDARPLKLIQRRALLERLFKEHDFDAVALTIQMEPTEENHQRLLDLGFEGTVIKALDAPYASGKRGRGWSRLKPQTTIDAVVMGYKPGKNGFTGMVGALVFGQYDEDGTLVERGSCSGFDVPERVRITKVIDRLVEERAVIEVAHHGAMDDGLRHPQWKGFRPDRSPDDITLHDD